MLELKKLGKNMGDWGEMKQRQVETFIIPIPFMGDSA